MASKHGEDGQFRLKSEKRQRSRTGRRPRTAERKDWSAGRTAPPFGCVGRLGPLNAHVLLLAVGLPRGPRGQKREYGCHETGAVVGGLTLGFRSGHDQVTIWVPPGALAPSCGQVRPEARSSGRPRGAAAGLAGGRSVVGQ